MVGRNNRVSEKHSRDTSKPKFPERKGGKKECSRWRPVTDRLSKLL